MIRRIGQLLQPRRPPGAHAETQPSVSPPVSGRAKQGELSRPAARALRACLSARGQLCAAGNSVSALVGARRTAEARRPP